MSPAQYRLREGPASPEGARKTATSGDKLTWAEGRPEAAVVGSSLLSAESRPLNAITPCELLPDTAEHSVEVEALYDRVFGPGRYAKTAERLREGNSKIEEASFVAVDSEGLCGVVRIWPVAVGGTKRAAFLGPIAVSERRRNSGVAFKLMERSIGVCRELNYSAVILVGDEAYYSRFGFARAAAGRFVLPGPVDPKRILVRELSPAAAELMGALSVPRAARPA